MARALWRSCAGFLMALALPAPDLAAYDTFGDGFGSKWEPARAQAIQPWILDRQ